MGRTKGAQNVKSFQRRTSIETSPSSEVRHLSGASGNPLEDFRALLKHQENFLTWLDGRHKQIVVLSEENKKLRGKRPGKGPVGAKEATFEKYRWYVQQLVLLEAINAFETFYKRTLVELGKILQDYVNPDEFRDVKLDARLIWSTAGLISASALMFEQSLFHDLEAIDKCCKILTGERRYMQTPPTPALKRRVKALRGIFQVRHTLSHNNGQVTDGDAAKFKRFGFTVKQAQIIDPQKQALGLAIIRELGDEARAFTEWLAGASARFLQGQVTSSGAVVLASKKSELEALLGSHSCWASVTWS